ncbi:MAG: hypothetical protein CMB52_00190 [Euryarchaeota archaeon]|nr:hypothetical protein [Euryarchaeota archaeon]
MSGDGFAAKRRADAAEQSKSAHQDASLLEQLKAQAGSMVGMAGMFVVTILLAMKIQPFYNHDEIRAFGAEGSTKAGFILIELVFIFLFTALIIYLARRNLQKFIKWGVLGILWIAMIYTLYPLAAMVLVPEAPPLTSNDMDVSESYIVAVEEGGANFFYVDYPMSGNATLEYAGNAGEIEYWSHNITPEDGFVSGPVELTRSADGIVMCEGTQWVLLDADSGDVIDIHTKDCDVGLRQEVTVPEQPTQDWKWESCDGQDDIAQDWSITDIVLEPIPVINDGDIGPRDCGDGWLFPEAFDGKSVIFVQEFGSEHFLIVSPQWAGMVKFPTQGQQEQAQPGEQVETTWDITLSDGESFATATLGAMPGINVSGQDTLLLGTSQGRVMGWDVHENGTVEDRMTMELSDSVRGVLLADCCSGGSNDLWVIEGDHLRIFMGGGMSELTRSLEVGGDDPRISMALHNIENPDSTNDDAILMIEQYGEWTSMQYTAHPSDTSQFLIYTLPGLIALVMSIGLLIALIMRPEWYVINTVGVLVGAGTITMLGVSFVPWIIIIFMVLAAIYDAWAVYKSKHMLELADTMVNLELPVMLVAPQKPTRGRVKIDRRETSTSEMPMPPRKGLDETMLMGLGDVIFPGLLCISAMSFLPDVEGPLGWSAPIWVAIGTMIGSLVGYCILMTYVARGKPQAGLPLLNGGAILGYFISGMIFIGSSAFVFDISLF